MGKCNIRAFVDTLETPTIETWDNNNNFLKSIKYSDETYYPLPVLTDAYNGYVLKVDENNQWMLSDDFLSHDWSKITWADGTDDEIVAMVEAADQGKINLADYWSVGDVRQVQLSAMAATGVGENHAAQTATLVLMDKTCTGFTFATATSGGKTKPSFIVGLKNSLAEAGYMNATRTNANGWSGSERRTWCNNVFRMAIPSAIRGIFKQFKWKQGKGAGNSSGLLETTDYFGLAPEKTVFGAASYSFSDEAALYNHWTWYQTSDNRIKKLGESGSASNWWECSTNSVSTYHFCDVDSGGYASNYHANNTRGLAPFGCI